MICKCKKCGHKWIAKIKVPLSCPRCKSYKYNDDNPQGTYREVLSKKGNVRTFGKKKKLKDKK